MPSKRRGTVVLRWRATDTEGLKQPVAPDYAEVKLNTQCTPGHRYMNWWWDTSRCFACSPGWHNQGDVYDQTSCQECLPGSVADVSGKTRCDKCPVGTFQPRYGQSVCLQCYDGTGLEIQTEQDGSSSIEQCVCRLGASRTTWRRARRICGLYTKLLATRCNPTMPQKSLEYPKRMGLVLSTSIS